MKKLMQNNKGFTLIELMIVVVIIGILAAIAIPNFIKYQLKSRSAEAPINVKAIFTAQHAFAGKYRVFADATAYPTQAMITNGGGKYLWNLADVEASHYSVFGFKPSGSMRFTYSVSLITTENPGTVALNTALEPTGTGPVVFIDVPTDVRFGMPDCGGGLPTTPLTAQAGCILAVPGQAGGPVPGNIFINASTDLDSNGEFQHRYQSDEESAATDWTVLQGTEYLVSGESLF